MLEYYNPYYLQLIQYIIFHLFIHIFRGQTFKNGRSTIATQGKLCTGKSSGISVDINPFEPHILAANLAHAIGHNMGFSHDRIDGKSHLMAAFEYSGQNNFIFIMYNDMQYFVLIYR